MNHKENFGMNPSIVKPEPFEAKIPPAPLSISSSSSNTTSSNVRVKPEPSLNDLLDQAFSTPAFQGTSSRNARNTQDKSVISAAAKKYTVYHSATELPYSTETALKEGLAMVQHMKTYLNDLNLGSKLRQEVWKNNILNLEAHTTPKTLIAVCGATGAGKSSILNALLDDNIVPTSGMRACTAVVTEIAHHANATIDADVSFLSGAEWRQELSVLQHDLQEEDGSLKRTSDLKSDAGVAWQKVSFLSFSLGLGGFDQTAGSRCLSNSVSRETGIASVLGTIKHISARDSRVFSEEIAKYIDSKDQSRGKKDKKKKDSGDSEKSLMDKVREAAGTSKKKYKKDLNTPAFWPLIRQVNVRCPAECLSSGCVLVDLPGVADANAARNSIAKDYMKKAQCIWVLAPITRAVDDKAARELLGDAFKLQLMSKLQISFSPANDFKPLYNGNYDDHTITFIASKTDDISCSEVIRALQLEDDPELEVIEEELEKITDDIKESDCKRKESDKVAKGIERELKTLRAIQKEHRDHIEALKNGEDFTPVLTATAASGQLNERKRKNHRKGKQGDPKRRRSSADPDKDSDEDLDEYNSDCNSSDSSSENDSEDDSDKDSSDSSDDEDGSHTAIAHDSDFEVEALIEEVTEEAIQSKLDKTHADISEARSRLSDARKEKKTAIDRIANLKKSLAKFSRDVLKEDFRTGLKELDDEVAEKKDPDNFDPTVQLRGNRDYVRLINQVKGDGEPTCFSDKASTGIPGLQAWCHKLTVSSRTRAVKNFFELLKTFATSISLFVSGIGGVTLEDRRSLQDKWASQFDDNDNGAALHEDPFTAFMEGVIGYDDLIAIPKKEPKFDKTGEFAGITPRLNKEFANLIDGCVDQMKAKFKDGLEDKCRIGASESASSAVELSDSFAASMYWSSYRATLRRHGEWRRNLNVELLAPFTKNIASSWGKTFEADLFRSFEEVVQTAVRRLTEDMAESAAPGLKERVKMQGDLCLEESDVALKQAVAVVRDTVNTEQKEVSRSLATHVQNNLVDGYELAMEERGTGSVARQKLVFRTFLSERKDDVFDEGADVLMGRLDDLCSSVGEALLIPFKELAKKIEVNLAVLWENVHDDPKEAVGRRGMLGAITEILSQTQLWLVAASNNSKSVSATEDLQDADMEMA
ncbi:hypothetical protein D9757_000094 [Collybiopsis confluens]|uniref:Nuclear GTPase SLIP-GC n=1 Tax=Collybiopsis confluens TaxID=2823264 RepID=A0A8H5MH82_9AGAR|nr:hypothetical protein D9757_000094 [Collybiopsis confluens]